MDDLITWLRQQLADEKAHAEKDLYVLDRATSGGAWSARYGHNLPSSEIWADGGIAFRIETPRHAADAMAVARFVKLARERATQRLAEVEARRAILAVHTPVNGYDPNGSVCSTCGETGNPGDETAVVRWPCQTVRLLAQPYAGRPGWREEWSA